MPRPCAVKAARLLAVLLIGALFGVTPAVAKMEKSSGFPWRREIINAADAPGRCSADKEIMKWDNFDVLSYGKEIGGDPESVDDQVKGLLMGDVRIEPWGLHYFSKTTDYFNHRKEVQKRIEDAIAALAPSLRPKAWANYAISLHFLGEFKKVIAYFGPRGPHGKGFENDGTVQFALAQSLYRLGRYAQSREYARRAFDLLPDAQRDTRWVYMVDSAHVLGKKFFTTPDPLYTTEHIKKAFPTLDWELPFEDVAQKMGLGRWGGYGATTMIDLDGDGWADIMYDRKFFGFDIYKNLKGKGFQKVPRSNIEGPEYCNAVGANPADYDNSGKPSLFRACCNFDGPGEAMLLKNEGGMRFKDVSQQAGFDKPMEGGMPSGCWADYDLDGNLDLAYNSFRGPTRLFHNLGNGKFEDVTEKAGIKTPGGRANIHDFGGVGCTFVDLNGDGLPDLYLQGWGWRKLYINNGDGTFRDETEKSGLAKMGERRHNYASIMDYNNDGKPDILSVSYVVGSNEKWGITPICTCSNILGKDGFSAREMDSATTIFRNNGDGTFTDMVKETRFLPLGVMGISHGDWNNDGWEDVWMGAGGAYFQQVEPVLFYQNNGDGSFTNKTPFLAFSLWGKGHGGAFEDYDHDGNLDLLLNNGAGVEGDIWPMMLLHNKGNDNHFLRVRLKAGKGTNKSAIGAFVRAWAGDLKQLRVIQSGGAMANGDFVAHFGLARNRKVDKLVVEWPNKQRSVTTLTDLDVDQEIEVSQDDGSFRRLWSHPHGAAPKAPAR